MTDFKILWGKTARLVYLTLAVAVSFLIGRSCQPGFIEAFDDRLPFGKRGYPNITPEDIPSLAGTWVLTDDSIARLRNYMSRYWSRNGIVPTSGVQATTLQKILSATTLTLDRHAFPMPIGIRDLGPADSSGGAPLYFFPADQEMPYNCATELFGWTVLNEPAGIYGSTFSAAKEKHPKMRSILLIRSQFLPDWWESSYQVFISENGKLMLLGKYQISEDGGRPIVLKWRHTDYFTGADKPPVSAGAGEQPR